MEHKIIILLVLLLSGCGVRQSGMSEESLLREIFKNGVICGKNAASFHDDPVKYCLNLIDEAGR